MGDQKTRDKIAKLLMGECPIVAICDSMGRPPKCKYLGFTNRCDSCTYPWGSIADDAIRMIGSRRTNTETERRARLELEGSVVNLLHVLTDESVLWDMMLSLIQAKEEENAAKEIDGIEMRSGGVDSAVSPGATNEGR